MEFKIEKDNWSKVKLGDVFTKREENDKENAKNRFDVFLKVNHMDAESLHIKRWSSQENGDELNPYFYKIFRKGQILFPTRNPHLKRTALAHFDGITGEKTLTLEPNEEFLNPKFIPFLFHSESFYAHTTGAIIGSTNPHVRWRDVANYEFLLPPKEQQAQLAKLLWAMDEVIEKEKEVLSKGNILFKKKLENSLVGIIDQVSTEFEKKDGFIQRKLPEIPLNWSYDLVKNEVWFQEGPGVRTTQFREEGVKLLNGTNINDNKLDLDSTNRFISEYEAYGMYNHFLCDKGDLIIACSGIAVEKFNEKITYVSDEHLPLCMNTSTMRFKEKSGNVTLDYFKYFLMSNLFKFQINRLITGSAQLNFGPSHMEKIYMPICSFDEQKEIVNVLNQIKESNLQLEFKISSSQSLQKSIINQVF